MSKDGWFHFKVTCDNWNETSFEEELEICTVKNYMSKKPINGNTWFTTVDGGHHLIPTGIDPKPKHAQKKKQEFLDLIKRSEFDRLKYLQYSLGLAIDSSEYVPFCFRSVLPKKKHPCYYLLDFDQEMIEALRDDSRNPDKLMFFF
jgi:hypothetical protein